MGSLRKEITTEAKPEPNAFEKGLAAYENGEYIKALCLFEQVAEQGDAASQFKCAVMYFTGRGTVADRVKALYWYEKAAEQGNENARKKLTELMLQSEVVPNAFERGMDAYMREEYSEALCLLEQAAREGNAKAQELCGEMYFYGHGTVADRTKALYWLEQAAEQGDVDGQLNCGLMYSEGQTEEDKAKALHWLEKAAQQGHATAQFVCGEMHFNGRGTMPDKAKALYWFKKAAAQVGNVDIQMKAKKILQEHF